MLFTVLIGVIGALIYALRNAAVKTRFWVSGGKRRKSEKDSWPYVIFTDSKRYWNLFRPICNELEKRQIPALYLTASEDDPALSENRHAVEPGRTRVICVYMRRNAHVFAE